MKVTSKGFDPNLGRKMAQEQAGSVVGRVKRATPTSRRSERDMPPGLDAQQQHEWLNGWMDDDQPYEPRETS